MQSSKLNPGLLFSYVSNFIKSLVFVARGLYFLYFHFSVRKVTAISQPGNDKQIENFCIARGAKSANLFCKGDVNGDNTRPTYRFLKAQGVVDKVAWNFQGKFLVDKEGNGKQFVNSIKSNCSFDSNLVLPVTDPTTLSQQIIELLLK